MKSHFYLFFKQWVLTLYWWQLKLSSDLVVKKRASISGKSHFPYYLTLARTITLFFSTPRSQTSYHFMRAQNSQAEPEMRRPLDWNDTQWVRYKAEPASMRRRLKRKWSRRKPFLDDATTWVMTNGVVI